MPVYPNRRQENEKHSRSIERDPVMDGVLLAPAPFSI